MISCSQTSLSMTAAFIRLVPSVLTVIIRVNGASNNIAVQIMQAVVNSVCVISWSQESSYLATLTTLDQKLALVLRASTLHQKFLSRLENPETLQSRP
jgi:hypothetical protein